jgi:hypothetical protein
MVVGKTNHLQRGFLAQLKRRAVPQYLYSPEEREWAQVYPDRPAEHLCATQIRQYTAICWRDRYPTSFCDLRKGQTGAPLKVNVLAVYER